MNEIPSQDLEMKAADDRRRLHTSFEELKYRLKDEFDLQKKARQHLGLACGLVAIVALTVGYSFTGIFVHR
jgi:hypothetical protein